MSTTVNAAIGRPRLFDEEAVLARLTALFWRQGYGQTSMTDIVEASGVHKPSLYRTFGTKEELFATVLRRYLAERIGMFAALIKQSGPGINGVHTFLTLFEADAVSERGRDGCLMVMASNELRGTLPGYDFSADYRRQMREQISTLITQALPDAGDGTYRGPHRPAHHLPARTAGHSAFRRRGRGNPPVPQRHARHRRHLVTLAVACTADGGADRHNDRDEKDQYGDGVGAELHL